MNFLASANWTIWQDVYVAVCYHNLLIIECENLATNISSLSSELASVCVSVCVCQCVCVYVCTHECGDYLIIIILCVLH